MTYFLVFISIVDIIFQFVIALVFFCLTSYFSTSSTSTYIINGPKLDLKLELYKKSSVFVNGSNDDYTTNYKNIYKQHISDKGSLVSDVNDVDNGKFK